MDPLRLISQVSSNLSSDDLLKMAEEQENKLAKLKEARENGDTEAVKELTNQGGSDNVEVVIKPMTADSIDQGTIALGFDRKGTLNTEANSRRSELENSLVSNLSQPVSKCPTLE